MSLRTAQRAWITYRDAYCDYRLAEWGAGTTGGGQALAECLMTETALQALKLEGHWVDR